MSEATKNLTTMSMTLSDFQRDFVDQIAQAIPPARFLLSAPTGAGKAIALVAAACALHSKRSEMRSLIIAPKALAGLWGDQLTTKAGIPALEMNPQTYRRLQAESGSDVNVWAKISCAIASAEFLSIADRIEDVLESGWDLIIIDEVHLFSKFTKRGEVAEKIWKSQSVKVAIAASSTPEPFEWIAADAGTTKIRWSVTEAMKAVGFPERCLHTINYEPSIPEQQIAVLIDDLVSQMPKDQASQFAADQVSRCLGSSMYALEQTLRRLLTVENFGDTDLNDWAPEDLSPEVDAGAGANSVRIDRQATEQILALLEGIPSDSKWECCLHMLETHGIGRTRSCIVFTDYTDTAEYLEFMASGQGLNTQLLTGTTRVGQREESIEKAMNAPTILIVTGAVEGVSLGFTDQVIHYDLPFNPRSLLQRMGRVERVSNHLKKINHYLIVERDADTDTTAQALMTKLRTIENAWESSWFEIFNRT